MSRLLCVGQGVFEVVGVLAAIDLDIKFSGNAGEVTGTGVGDDGDGEVGSAASHHAGVVQEECALAALQCAFDAFDGDVDAGVFAGGAAGEHLAVARAFEIAVKLFVEDHAAERRGRFVVGGLRDEFDVKGSAGVVHGGVFLRGRRGLGGEK